MGYKFYCIGIIGMLIQEVLKEKYFDVEWDFIILKFGFLGGDQQMGLCIVDGEIDYFFFFIDLMIFQLYDMDVKVLICLVSVENIVFCCNCFIVDYIILSLFFFDLDYEWIYLDYLGYMKCFENKLVVIEVVELVKKRKRKK